MFAEFDLLYHLVLLVFIAFFILGWHIVTRIGMLMDFFGKAFLYIKEEELLKQLPHDVRQKKMTTVMLFEGCLNDINKEGLDEASVEKKKRQLLEEFEDYLKTINEQSDATYDKLIVAYENKKRPQRWKKVVGKPLGNCVACSASVFGIAGLCIAYFPMFLSGTVSVLVIVFMVLSLPVISGMAVILESSISRKE